MTSLDKPQTQTVLTMVVWFLVAHALALGLAWGLASWVSQQHRELSPQGQHLRLVPLMSAR